MNKWQRSFRVQKRQSQFGRNIAWPGLLEACRAWVGLVWDESGADCCAPTIPAVISVQCIINVQLFALEGTLPVWTFALADALH